MSAQSTNVHLDQIDTQCLLLAIEQARKSQDEGGIPIGCVLAVRDESHANKCDILGEGHNQRIQKDSPTLHAEMAALENAGRLGAQVYRQLTIYTTLSPCSMCSGAILLFKIPRVVVGENTSFMGEETLLRSRGVEVIVVENQECKDMMKRFMEAHPKEWNEDIGEIY